MLFIGLTLSHTFANSGDSAVVDKRKVCAALVGYPQLWQDDDIQQAHASF